MASVRIFLSSLKCERRNGEVEDDLKTWANISIVSSSGDACSALWYAETDNLGKTSVTNGSPALYNYNRVSPEFALNTANLSAFVNSSVNINVFRGGNRDASKDELIGQTSIILSDLMDVPRIAETRSLIFPKVAVPGVILSSIEYKCQLSFEISANEILQNALISGKIISISDLFLTSIPKQWLPADVSDSATPDELNRIASLSTYYYSFCLANLFDGPVFIGNGRLRYNPPGRPITPVSVSQSAPSASSRPSTSSSSSSAKVAPSPKLNSSPDTQNSIIEAVAPPPPPGWVISFSSPVAFFLSESESASFPNRASSITCTLRRFVTEPLSPDSLTSDSPYGITLARDISEEFNDRGILSIDLSSLLEPGVQSKLFSGTLSSIPVDEMERKLDAEQRAERETQWNTLVANQLAKLGAKPPAKGSKVAPKAAPPAAKLPPKAPTSKATKGKAVKEEAPPTPIVGPYENGENAPKLSFIVRCKPLFSPPPPPEPPSAHLADLIPPPSAKVVSPPPAATHYFRRELTNSAMLVLNEYAAVLQQDAASGSEGNSASNEAKLLTHLRESGQYDAILDALRRSAAAIVSDQFAGLPGFASDSPAPDSDSLIARLYSYLHGHIGIVMNELIEKSAASKGLPPGESFARSRVGYSSGTQSNIQNSQQDSLEALGVPETRPEMLLRIAREFEREGSRVRALKTYQACIALSEEGDELSAPSQEDAARAWFELSLFYFRSGPQLLIASNNAANTQANLNINNLTQASGGNKSASTYGGGAGAGKYNENGEDALSLAEAALLESLSADGTNVPALLVSAALHTATGRHQDAMAFADGAVRALEAVASAELGSDGPSAGDIARACNLLPLALTLLCNIHEILGDRAAAAKCLYVAEERLSSLPGATDGAGRPAALYLLLARFLGSLRLWDSAFEAISRARSVIVDARVSDSLAADSICVAARLYMDAAQLVPIGGAAVGELEDNLVPGTFCAPKPLVSNSFLTKLFPSPADLMRALLRATHLDPSSAEAWLLRARATLARARAAPSTAASSNQPPPVPTDPDELEAGVLLEASDMLVKAVSTAAPPRATGWIHSSPPNLDDSGLDVNYEATSFSGIGGGLCLEPGDFASEVSVELGRLLLLLGARAAAGNDSARSIASPKSYYLRAREEFTRALEPSSCPSSSNAYALQKVRNSRAWRLLARAQLALDGTAAIEPAEAALTAANGLQPQCAETWARLALLCLESEPIREAEAAASTEHAFSAGLCGSSADLAELCIQLAVAWRKAGDIEFADAICARASAFLGTSRVQSTAHIEAMVRARITQAEIARELGEIEGSLDILKSAIEAARALDGTAPHAKARLSTSRREAAARAAKLLKQLGREAEAKSLLLVHGS